MNGTLLLKLLELGESETVEFKESFDKEIFPVISAFANAQGGHLLIGVADKSKIKGVKIGKETLQNWANEISQATEPVVIPEIEIYQIKEKAIVDIFIKESPFKPVAAKGLCYLRLKNSNRKLTPKEIAELHLQTLGSSWDSYPAPAKLQEIDLEKVKAFIKLANQTNRRKIQEKHLEVLKKLELIKNNRPTWAALLLFGREPQKFISQAKVHCGKFLLSKTEILDDKMIGGPLIEQVDVVLEFIKKHLSVKFVITGKPQREEIWEYPLEALREALINALIHRDYTLFGETQVEIYNDCLEIWNPGKLLPGLSLEDLYKKDHKSLPRNKLLAQAFYDIGFIEKYGSGTLRMLDLCEKAGIFLEFKEISNGFSVIFRKDILTGDYLKNLGLNERQVKAVAFVKETGRITNKKYQELYIVSKKTASRELTGLFTQDIFQRNGLTGKGTFYILKQRGQKGVRKGSEK